MLCTPTQQTYLFKLCVPVRTMSEIRDGGKGERGAGRGGRERESTHVLQSLQDDHTAALAPSVAVGLVGERVALTSRGDQSGLAEQNEHVGG